MLFDKWDIKLIQELKSVNPSIDALRAIWAERVGMSIDSPYLEKLGVIASRLYVLVNEIAPIDYDVIDATHPSNQWKYVFVGEVHRFDRHYMQWISYLATTIRQTEVSKIPNYPKETIK